MLERNILKFTWIHSRSAQIYILFIVLLSMPTYFMSLDLPKQIVNGPILGQGFETAGAEQTFMKLSWTFAGEEWVLFSGLQLERLNMLFALSGTFLTLIIINGLFKFYINTYKGRLGERMLRRIRYDPDMLKGAACVSGQHVAGPLLGGDLLVIECVVDGGVGKLCDGLCKR